MTEFAVIKTGGKQYQVKVGDVLSIEKFANPVKVGDSVIFDQVLLVDNGKETTIGTPFIKGAKVTATVESQGRAAKIKVVKYKQKSRYLVRRGHRQPFLKVKINTLG